MIETGSVINKLYYRETNKVISNESANFSRPLKSVIALCRQGHTDYAINYLREASTTCMTPELFRNCMAVVEECKDKKDYGEVKRTLLETVIPSISNLNIIEESIIPEDIVGKVKELVKEFTEYDRISLNHINISKRYNIDNITSTVAYGESVEYITESICELIDTYNMGIAKKIRVATEETIYSIQKHNTVLFESKDKAQKIISNTIDYFLSKPETITDKDYLNIESAIKGNILFGKDDIKCVNYLFNENNLYRNRIAAMAINESIQINEGVRNMLKSISTCTTVTAAKEIITEAFRIIFNLFIVTAGLSFAAVTIIICSLLSLILIVGCTPMIIVNAIKAAHKNEIEKKMEKTTFSKEEIAKAKKVRDYLDTVIKEMEANKEDEKKTLKEAANLVDQALIASDEIEPSLLNVDDPSIFATILIGNVYDIVQESESYANSNDIKDLIDQYKKEQNKDEKKFKAVMRKIYSKKPSQIIDETPHIFTFIRQFCILGLAAIPGVGIPLAVVTELADLFISTKVKREETEKMYKYFTKEHEKVLAHLDKLKDGTTKKDNLESYEKCLDKCLDKIKNYRNDLYSDAELDQMDEASAIVEACSLFDSMTFETLYRDYKDDILNSVAIAQNRFKERIETLKIPILISVEHDYNTDHIMHKGKDYFLKNYVTPAGMIDIPLLSVKGETNDIIAVATDISNNYLPSPLCNLRAIKYGEEYIITLDFARRIYNPNSEDSCTCEVKEAVSLFEMQQSIISEYDDLSVSTMDEELSSDSRFVTIENAPVIFTLIENAGLAMPKFINASTEAIKENYSYISHNHEYRVALESVLQPQENNIFNSDMSIVQLEAVRVLRAIITEAKENPDNKKPVNTVKNKLELAKKKDSKSSNKEKEVAKKTKEIKWGNIATKTKEGKLAITTNLALATEVMKKKVQSLGTKEKAISQTIDASMSTFKRGIEKSIVSDRREAIIKGSIIPSFSKMIKTAIVGGVGFAINPAIAAIGAIGSLAVSKALTDKERQLLLDEIEIELKVVEKELDIAEKEDNTKRYRDLLQYQRKLQRESQRIKYRAKVYSNKDIIDPTV